MGILTDFIIAKEGERDLLLESLDPSEKWDSLEYKNIDTVKVSTLYAIVKDEEFDFDKHDFDETKGDNEGPWVSMFSDDMIQSIANIESSKMKKIAAKWVSTEELELDGFEMDDALDIIEDLVKFTNKAIQMNSKVFLWQSL